MAVASDKNWPAQRPKVKVTGSANPAVDTKVRNLHPKSAVQLRTRAVAARAATRTKR